MMWSGDDHGNPRQLPDWANWLLELGQWAGRWNDSSLTQWVIISVPDRRYASSLLAHGVITVRLRSRTLPPVSERFNQAASHDGLTWIDTKGHIRFGRFRGLEDDRIVYEARVHGGWGVRTTRPLTHADTFWPADDLEPFVGPRPVAENPHFAAAATGLSINDFLTNSRVEVVVAGLRSEIDDDLLDRSFLAGENVGALRDTVRPKHLGRAGEHWRSLVVPSAADPLSLDTRFSDAPTIFDGPQAYLRLRDQLHGSVNIVVLDRWHPRSGDAAATARIERAETWVEHNALDLTDPPAGIELFAWAAER